jgi:hypothetical protein
MMHVVQNELPHFKESACVGSEGAEKQISQDTINEVDEADI